MLKRKLICYLVVVILICMPSMVNAQALEVGSAILNFFSGAKDFTKDALNLAEIMSDLKAIQKETKDKIADLYDYFDYIPEGNNIFDVGGKIADKQIPFEAKKTNADIESTSYILKKYFGEDYYQKAKAPIDTSLDNMRKSKLENPSDLSDETKAKLTDTQEKSSKISKLTHAEREQLSLKYQSQAVESSYKSEEYARSQADDLKDVANDVRAKQIAQEIENKRHNDIFGTSYGTEKPRAYNPYRRYLR